MSDPIGQFLSITWWRQVFQKTGKAFGIGCAVVFAVPLALVGLNQLNGRNADNAGAVSRDTPLMTVNGETVTMGEYYGVSQTVQMGTPGKVFASKTGGIVDALVQQAVIAQEAKRSGVKASDAEIDKSVQDYKLQALGKNATDADLEAHLLQTKHMSMSEFREQIAKGSVGRALVDDQKKKTVVTEEEARNQSAEVRLNVVLIPTLGASAFPSMKPDARALPDADAKKKAEALLAEVKSGKAHIATIAKANSADFNAKNGGDTGFRPEYTGVNGMPPAMGILGFGKDFDEAVHKAKQGDYIEVVKASGFQNGYLFAKLVERRNNLPKDFAPQKVVDELKEKRAQEAVIKKIEDLTKAAKVEFPTDRIEQKAFYDYFQLSRMAPADNLFGGQSIPSTPEQISKQQTLVDTELETVYKKDPTNTTAAILILDNVQRKIEDPKTPLNEKTALRERLLPLYQNVIKATEGDDYAYRFGLADALRDKKQFAEAYNNYHAVGHSLDYDTPTDIKAMQSAKQIRQRLAAALKTVASPEAPKAEAEATEQIQKVQELDGMIAQLQLKEAQERKLAEAERKRTEAENKKKAEQLKSQTPPKTGAGANATTPEGFGKSLDLSPGSSQTITVPPSGSQPAPTPPAKAPGTTPPTGQPKPTPPAGGTGR